MLACLRKTRVHPVSDNNDSSNNNHINTSNQTIKASTTPSAPKVVDFVRRNGLTLPLHPLQVIAWFFILFFAVSYFVFMIPCMPSKEAKWIAGVINGVVLTAHLVIHALSVYCNPADDNVIQRYSSKAKPTPFDRSKHEHVIENQFCYICEVLVGPKSKHCSVCNKCVSQFDHHCKWLNNCVGGKNYR